MVLSLDDLKTRLCFLFNGQTCTRDDLPFFPVSQSAFCIPSCFKVTEARWIGGKEERNAQVIITAE